MSKHNRRSKIRKKRKWMLNVGDGGKLSQRGDNPNDAKRK